MVFKRQSRNLKNKSVNKTRKIISRNLVYISKLITLQLYKIKNYLDFSLKRPTTLKRHRLHIARRENKYVIIATAIVKRLMKSQSSHCSHIKGKRRGKV